MSALSCIRGRSLQIVFAVAVSLASWGANAQTNYCALLLEELVLPVEVAQCVDVSPVCIVLPQCCVPFACLADPLCATMKVTTEVMKAIPKGESYCRFSPDEVVDRWLHGQVSVAADVLTGPLQSTIYAALDSNIAVLAGGARPLTESTKAELRGLAQPVYAYGEHGFSYSDIEDVRVVPARYGNASWFLRTWGGITLSNIVVLQNWVFDALFDSPTNLDDFQWERTSDPTYAKAVMLLSHELVHVAQYRRYGADSFRTNYVVDTLIHGQGSPDQWYWHSTYENEAYQFQAELALPTGGKFCPVVKAYLTGYGLMSTFPWDQCGPYKPRVSSLWVVENSLL